MTDRFDRVCIVLLTGLGDVVLGLPVAVALKRDRPERRITWVAEPMPARVLEGHPAVDDVVVFHKEAGIAGVRRLWRELRRRRFDLALNLNIYIKSVFPLIFSGAPVRLGFDRGRSRDATWLFANRHLPRRPRAHTQDMFLEFLELLGIAREPVDWQLAPTDAERAEQARFFARFDDDRPVVAIVAASAHQPKDWLPERCAEVVDALEHDFGFHTMLVGGPGAREQALARTIVEHARARPVWALGDGVRRLLWLIEGSDLLIAPDTGPVHIARAMEVPVIGLYGHTNPWRVGPWRAFQDLWIDRYTEPGAAPDPSAFDSKPDRMQRITARDVLERVERAIERYGIGARPRRGRNVVGREEPTP